MNKDITADAFRAKRAIQPYSHDISMSALMRGVEDIGKKLARYPHYAYRVKYKNAFATVAVNADVFALLSQNRARYNRAFSAAKSLDVVHTLRHVQVRHLPDYFVKGGSPFQVVYIEDHHVVLISPLRYGHLLKNPAKKQKGHAQLFTLEQWRTEDIPDYKKVDISLKDFALKYEMMPEGLTWFRQNIHDRFLRKSPFQVTEVFRYSEGLYCALNSEVAKLLLFSVKHGKYAWSAQQKQFVVYKLEEADVSNLHLYTPDIVRRDAVVVLPSGLALVSHARFMDALTRLRPGIQQKKMTIPQLLRRIGV